MGARGLVRLCGRKTALDLSSWSAEIAPALTANEFKPASWRIKSRQQINVLVADTASEPCGVRRLINQLTRW